jgi:transcriptional regulator with XRE-family HTH domain
MMQQHLVRAARALLGLTQADLAGRARVALGTLVSYEAGARATQPEAVARIRVALEDAGIVFRPDGSLTTCQQILDAFAQLKNPTSQQKAEAVVAAQRLALAGGHQEPPSDFAIAVMRADRKRRGLED